MPKKNSLDIPQEKILIEDEETQPQNPKTPKPLIIIKLYWEIYNYKNLIDAQK